MKKIKLTETDLHKLIRFVINELVYSDKINILNETHIKNLYHFMSPESLFRALSTGKFELNSYESSYHPGYKYFLSTTRNRNSVQGYPFMCSDYGMGGTKNNLAYPNIIIRVEINGESLRKYGKVKPFDWMYHNTQDEWGFGGYEIRNGKQDSLQSDDEIERRHQPFSQAEERLMSNRSEIPFNGDTVNKIEAYVQSTSDEDEIFWIKKLKKLEQNGIITIYYNRNHFNNQINRLMADGSGTYVPGKGWMEEAVTRAIRKYLK